MTRYEPLHNDRPWLDAEYDGSVETYECAECGGTLTSGEEAVVIASAHSLDDIVLHPECCESYCRTYFLERL